MSTAALPSAVPALAPIPLRMLLPWVAFGGALMLTVLFLVTAQGNPWVHEWVHDGRHLLGVPCH